MVSVVMSLACMILPQGVIYSPVPTHMRMLSGSSCTCLSQKPSARQDQDVDHSLAAHTSEVLYRHVATKLEIICRVSCFPFNDQLYKHSK